MPGNPPFSQPDSAENHEDDEEDEEEIKDEKVREAKGQIKQVHKLVKRLSGEQVQIRVHDVKIKGNTRTKDSVIEAVVEEVKNAKTMQELVQAAAKANARLQSMGIFESATITLDAGPPELPDTANVIVEVQESDKPFSGDIGIFSKPEELDFRYAIPLGFYNAALNIGFSAGIILPWGKGFKDRSIPISDRFFMGGHSSPICNLRGPLSLLGFRSRGVGPTEARRDNSDSSKTDDASDSSGRDTLGGDIAVTSFADLSFDLPLKVLRDSGIHGHCFVCAGNLAILTGDYYRPISFREFGSSFRSSAGAGIVIPTKLARIEINYCQILRQLDHDRAKRGIQFSFSS